MYPNKSATDWSWINIGPETFMDVMAIQRLHFGPVL
jgi:hypothetical protein